MHPGLPDIIEDWLPYCSGLQFRDPGTIDLVVIHCTELPDLKTAREFGERIHHADSGTGNSGHFYVERTGRIEQWVPLDRAAHHVRGFNETSIGIELDNRGRYPDWFDSRHQEMTQAYTVPQIESLLLLLRKLQKELPGLRHISGHETLDTDKIPASDDASRQVLRKRDPGSLFPWKPILRQTGLEFFDPAKA